MIHIVLPLVVTTLIAANNFSPRRGLDLAFFDRTFDAALAAFTTGIGLWMAT